MAAIVSIIFLVFGAICTAIGFSHPQCSVHGDKSIEFFVTGLVCICISIAIAVIGATCCSCDERKRAEIEAKVDEHYDKAKQELDEKTNNKFFYDTLMENDELYKKCMKNWQIHIKTLVKDAFGNMTHIPDAVIEDVMSEREIVFPERFGTVVKGQPS